MADKRTGRRPKFERRGTTAVTSLDELYKNFYEAKISEGVLKRTLD